MTDNSALNSTLNLEEQVVAQAMDTNAYSHYTNPKHLPQPSNQPIKSAVYKASPSDFIVEEILNIEFNEQQDQCEHLWLLIKKTGINTTHIANELAKWAKIPARDVGYSGLKDRHAITTQWFSLRIPTGKIPPHPFTIIDEENSEFAEVLTQHWHNKKLNRSTHQFNRFIISLRDVTANKEAVEDTLNNIAKNGVPNYFGEQRFGREGGNMATALEWFEQGTINGKAVGSINKKGRLSKKEKQIERKNKELQSILLSAARSAIFNQILAKRVTDGSWLTAMDGEVFNLAGSGSVFATTKLDNELKQRIASNDILPTGAMWGIANEKACPQGQALNIETEVVNSSSTLQRLANGLEAKTVKAARRPLKLLVHDLTWQWQDDKTLVLDFKLPAGSFATSVLAGLIA